MKAKPMTLSMLLLPAVAAFAMVLFASHAHSAEPKPARNRLADSRSPYLLQHAHQPVDWYPWGPEAFEKARKENKPVFLSVGYSTCHWCHVMAHESFDDETVAKILNEHYVAIKVDREEMPDIDEQYMLATQLMTRRGGWPNSVWLMPDKRPWFAGTYFPREDRMVQTIQGPMKQEGFKSLLLRLADIWKTRRLDVESQAGQLSEAIRKITAGEEQAVRPLGKGLVTQAVRAFQSSYDAANGGFGSAPKFPPHGMLALLMRHYERAGDLAMLDVIGGTLDAMALGGFCDHVGGGFHRYSTDARWFLPHFEKMLYDNAQLISLYTRGHKLLQEPLYEQRVAETFAWLKREMTDPVGGFYSALDADSEGEEGKFYLWSQAELVAALGAETARTVALAYGATPDGNHRDEASGQPTGSSILYLQKPAKDLAADLKIAPDVLEAQLAEARARLLKIRDTRIRPHLDDKVLTGWNGLMIGALAEASSHFKKPEYLEAARKSADFILKDMRDTDNRLLRVWRKGQAHLPGYLEDYAFLARGLLRLAEHSGEKKYQDAAVQITTRMVADFGDADGGGFFVTSENHEMLLARSRGMSGGGNIPIAAGVAAEVLLELGVATDNPAWIMHAAKTLQSNSTQMASSPHGSESLLAALDRLLELADQKKIDLAALQQSKATDADALVQKEPVTAELFIARLAVRPGARVPVALKLNIDKPWHIYSNQPGSDIPIPTKLELSDGPGKLDVVAYPPGHDFKDPGTGQLLKTYEGEVWLRTSLQIADDAPAGEHEFTFKLRLQACDDRTCMLPERHELKVKIRIDSGAADTPLRHPKIFSP